MSPLYNGLFEPEKWRAVIWPITSIFESGRPEGNPATYQTFDAGIVSYGKHQATLSAGSLGLVLDAYYSRSQSSTCQRLQQEFDARVKSKDETLRDDADFKSLLIEAASEQEMVDAQDSVFNQFYYQPAITRAQQCALSSPLGLAVIYDIRIQGGWSQVLARLTARLGSSVVGQNGITEEQWIAVFLDEREAWLNEIANNADVRGDTANGNALRISTFRVRELSNLSQAGNYGLVGPFTVRGWSLPGLPPTQTPPPQIPNSQLVDTSSSVPLDAVDPGTKVTITWTVRNTGTQPWDKWFRIINILNDPGRVVKTREFLLDTAADHLPVTSGTDVKISVSFYAPVSGHIHRGQWQMADDNGDLFGAIFPIELQLKNAPYLV
jgi:hypothetical protein